MVKIFGKAILVSLSLHPLSGGVARSKQALKTLNEGGEKKFEEIVKKIWKGSEKGIIFVPAFAPEKGFDSAQLERKSS